MFEREFPPLISEKKVMQAASSLTLTAAVRFANASKTVATCELKNNAGSTLAEGAGKGRHCKIGAIAESLEHYVLQHDSLHGVIECSSDDIRHQTLLTMDGLTTNLPDSKVAIDCVEMTDIKNGKKAIIPAILQLPHLHLANRVKAHPKFSFLGRYASNSGIAFGCSENEAILHGLNEVIERHILSKVFMSLCGQHERLQLKIPSIEVLRDTFPEQADLRTVINDMKILIIKTIYGVYFSIAIPKRPNGRHPVCPVGSGCSIDPRVAIERAASELLQVLELSDEAEKANDLRAYTLIKSSLALHPLIHLEMLRSAEQTCKRLDPPERTQITEQIDYIIEKISATGLRIFHRTLLKFDNGCTVNQIYIPGTERFNLIRAGIPVVPQHLLHANKSFI